MNSLNLKSRNRRKKSRGSIAGILYGKGRENFMFEIGELELNQCIKESGEHGILNAQVDGKEEMVLIKEVQRDPVKHNILHIDLESVSGEKEITTDIPIYYEHEGIVKSNGGILQKEKSSIKVKGSVNNIPEKIKIDLAAYRLGDIMRVGDIELGEDLTFMEPLNSVVLSVTHAKYEEDEEENERPNEVIIAPAE